MPGHYCCVCASNEGVFLDITPDNQDAFGDQVEACLSTKINDIIDLSNKICYKCAYELDHCTKFVQKYKKSHGPETKKVNRQKASTPCCFLCYELVKSDRIFDLAKDNNVLFNPLRKIRSIFNDEVCKNGESKLICLTCRYNLDVLYDLKRVYQETIINLKALINKEINYSNIPKVHTEVVNRKTTITTFPDVTFYGSINSDSDSNEESMARSSKRRGKGRRSSAQTKLQDVKLKVRNCDKCHSTVANGIDMYRFHRTGLTVCKNCWITMDPNDKPQRRKRQSNLAETKLCAVFLTDVKLTDIKELCKEKTHEEDKSKDSTLYDSSQDETKSSGSSPRSVSPRTKNHIVNGKARQGKKRRIDVEKPKDDDVERTPPKMTRMNRESANASETKSITVSVDSGPSSSTQSVRTRGHKKKITADKSSDSDGSLKQKETHNNIKLNDHVNKTSSKKRQKVEEKSLNIRTDSSDETSNEESMSLKSRMKGMTRLPSSASTKSEKERSAEVRMRSSSRSSTEMAPSTEFKNPQSSTQSETKTEYTCDLCNKKFDTKLSNSQHKLTHLKQASLKLKKITVPIVKEKSEAEVNLQDDKSSKKATSHRSKRTASDRHINDPSEDIAINIEDDTDDEELVSLSRRKEKIELRKNACDEDSDKPDVSKSESRVEKESADDGNSETKEFEQCEESTVVTDETINIEDEGSRNKEVRDKRTTNEDEISTSRDNDNSKNKDTETTVAVSEERNVDKADDKDIENETESSFVEKEKTISKCNSRDNLQEEITLDRETSRSPILLIHKRSKDNKNYSESCKNNLEKNSNDNEEIIEEPEIIQNDSTDESLKKDTKALEENIQKDLPNNVTEALSDSKRDSDDDIIINEDIIMNEVNEIEELKENQQDRSNEESMEVEMIVDKFSSVEDIVNADISNGERHDDILDDNDEADVTVVVNSDSFDDKVKHKITDKTILTDDSKEENQLDEEIKELEELVDDNIVNNKHEAHENFTCVSDNNSVDVATEILKEVFDLAAAEVQHREDTTNVKNLTEIEMETLENISREIRKSADMPSLDPINMMDIDDDNDITLN
ncbi:COPII coat assembly protein SEC16 [Monomorium pharaonis]|uniref:COPII coat assembly protein SEC16 n=1 Tax=Monomorium pharaonis TaxID=307658 RepID=UPI00063F3007|nr:COPII coat assembly protein SEC16 [Monomorium pharaonis]